MAFLVVWTGFVLLVWWVLSQSVSSQKSRHSGWRPQNRRRSMTRGRLQPLPVLTASPQALEQQLVYLLQGDRAAAHRLVASIRQRHPQESVQWCWEKAIWDLERDRFR